MKAELKNYRQSPRKVRLVADLIKGQTVPAALEQLDFLAKRAAGPISKLLKSAVANAKEGDKDQKDKKNSKKDVLVVGNIRVDQGATLRRSRPRARGSAYRINKRTSHVQVTLERKF